MLFIWRDWIFCGILSLYQQKKWCQSKFTNKKNIKQLLNDNGIDDNDGNLDQYSYWNILVVMVMIIRYNKQYKHLEFDLNINQND